MFSDKQHILAYIAETSFLQFKEQSKFKNEISAIQCSMKAYRLISLLSPVKSRWIIALRIVKVKHKSM